MKIKEIISLLENQGEWVNRHKTRDQLLYGDIEKDVDNVVVCWVATNRVIEQAIQSNCHFIITHENLFYESSTSLHSKILEAQNEKKDLLKKHDITVYRCHDLWDLFPEYGVRDRWAQLLDFSLEPPVQKSFIRIAYDVDMSVKELAHHISQRIGTLGESGIEVIGNLNKKVNRLAIGTGACTDVFDMSLHDVDACLVSDDGINNWISVQWAMDHDVPLLVVNHMTSEASGIKGLRDYLSQMFPSVNFHYIPNDYGIYHMS